MENTANPVASSETPLHGSAGAAPRLPRISRFREVPWRWSDVLVGFAPFLLFCAASVLMDPQSTLMVTLARLSLPTMVVNQLWLVFVPIWIARARQVNVLRIPRPRAVVVEALFALLALPAFVVGAIAASILVSYLIGPAEPGSNPWSPVTGPFGRTEWVVFIVSAVAVAPVAEEFFYRGLFYNALRQRIHPILAASIQAVVFGLVHYPLGPANSAAIAIGGVILAVLYEWRKTLLAPIFLHAVVNMLGLLYLAPSFAADAAAPRLGVYGDAYRGGCRVREVVQGSAADAAGLQVGDVITAADGRPITDIRSLAKVVRTHQVGRTVSVEFLRGGEAHRIDVVLKRLRE